MIELLFGVVVLVALFLGVILFFYVIRKNEERDRSERERHK